jgi:hypothetical protein
VNTSTGERFRDLHLAKRRAEQFDLLDGIANEIGETIDGRCQLK